ncbi:hypothetical protein V8E53_007427 [Lactarius tabidus]
MSTGGQINDSTHHAIEITHEATLQDLIKNKNSAIWHLLLERNQALCKQNEFALRLGYKQIDFSDYNHITPLDPPLPYTVTDNGVILRYCINRPGGPWACFPVDQQQFDASVQTDNASSSMQLADPDATMQMDDPDTTHVEEDMEPLAFITKVAKSD